MSADESLSVISIDELKQELPEGLRIYAETAWGWSELKAAAFVKQVEKSGGKVTAYCDVIKGGAISLKVPRHV